MTKKPEICHHLLKIMEVNQKNITKKINFLTFRRKVFLKMTLNEE